MATINKREDYYKDTEYFCLYNINPTRVDGKKWDKGDCVVRAFAMAADISWLEAFDLLVENARKTFNVPNYKTNYKDVFAGRGFVYQGIKAVAGKKRMTVEDFCKKHKKGRYILDVANHMTAVVDGVCYDVWNPANKCVYCYWELIK